MTPDWVRREASTFLALKGQVVASWQGNEMAVRDDPPQFGGPDVPCLQLDPLRMTFDTGMSLRVLAYQGDQAWSLGCADGGGWQDEDLGWSIFRRRSLPELPTGRIDEVAAYLDGDTLAEVTLRVGGHDLLIMAGEAGEERSGELSWHRGDESVLVFTEPGKADAMLWIPPREPLQSIIG